jgi:hypothetical protein
MSFALLLLLSVVATSVAYNSRSSLNFTSIPLIMSPSRQRHAACGVNSGTGRAFIAVAGGLLSDGKPTTRLTLFDTTTREFTDVAPPMRNARDGAAIGSSRGLVAVAGGSDGSAQNISMTGVEGLLDVVEIYNVTARMWLPEKTLAAARSDLVGVSTTNFIAFVGGRTSKPAASAHVDVLDARTLEFFSFNLVESRSFPAAAAIGDKIYVAGGDRGDPAGDSPLRFTVEEIDLVARRSRIVFTDTVGLYKTTGCAAGDFVVFAGGDRYVSANTLVPATERMRSLLRVPDTGNFVTNLFGGGSVLFSWPPAGMGAASVGSLAVYFGGRNSSSSFDFEPARAYAFEFDPVRFKNTSINDEGWIYDSDFKRAPVFNHAVASVSDETATYFAIIGGATGQQPGAITDSFALFEFPVAKYPQLAPVCSASPCTGGARCVAPNVCYATPPPTPLPPGDTASADACFVVGDGRHDRNGVSFRYGATWRRQHSDYRRERRVCHCSLCRCHRCRLADLSKAQSQALAQLQ